MQKSRAALPFGWLSDIYAGNQKVFCSITLLYTGFLLAVLFPLTRAVVSWTMRLRGYRYLTAENVQSFFFHPLTVFLLSIGFIIWMLGFSTGLYGLFYVAFCTHRNKACSSMDALRFCVRTAGKMLKKRSWLMFLFLLPCAVLMHLPSVIRILWNFIPAGIWRNLLRSRWMIVVLALSVLVLIALFLGWRFAACIWPLQEASGAGNAGKISRKLGRGRRIRDFFRLIFLQLQLLILYFVLLLFSTVVITLVFNLFRARGEVISSVIAVLQKVLFALYDMAVGIAMMTAICRDCMILCTERGIPAFRISDAARVEEDPFPLKENKSAIQRRREAWEEVLIPLFGVLIMAFYLFGTVTSRYRVRIEGLNDMQVTAHRGASMQCPENTMAAFYEAAAQGADWIELDVHESRDGQIFVMHDANFKRTTGVEANVWELTWDEIQQLDAGSSYSAAYAGEPIPLLSEVVEFAAQEGLRLNIELKPTGHEQHLVEAVLDIVERYHIENSCVITSQVYRVVEEVREHSDTVRTAYVSGMAYGAVNRMSSADAFSVQSVSISRSLVGSLHNRGIEVYAWTVDSRKNINRMIDYGVDNIITNNVPLAKRVIAENRTGWFVAGVMRSINAMFT